MLIVRKILSFSFSYNNYYKFARILTKKKPNPINFDYKIKEKTEEIPINVGNNESQLIKDIRNNDETDPTQEKELNTNNISSNIETYPDLLEPEDIQEALSKITIPIDSKFINQIKISGEINDEIWQKIKKKINLFPSSNLLKIAKEFTNYKKFNKLDKIWKPLEDEFTRRLHNMTYIEIIQLLWCFAYSNRANREFFRKIENELFERPEFSEMNFNYIGKILWAYSFSYLGSVELYNKISRTIRIAQYEIPALKLAQYANYFSKAPENVKGGFGVYKITEERLSEKIPDFSFGELVKISLFLFPQKIGSNAFYAKIEERLEKTFPNKNELSPSALVKLAKAFSVFRTQNNSLVNKIEDNVFKFTEFMSNSQLEETFWAFSKGKKGSKLLYEKFEKEILKRLNLLKSRSLAFIYYGFACSKFGSKEIFEKLEEKINEKLNEMNNHYILKILKAMQILKNKDDSVLRQNLIKLILKRQNLKDTEIIKMLTILTESNFIVKNNLLELNEIFISIDKKFDTMIQNLKITEICSLFYILTMFNQLDSKKSELLMGIIIDVNKIPKSVFCSAFWSVTQNKYFDISKEFIPIINNLVEFGDIKYFFDHDSFIKLSWSLIITNMQFLNKFNKNYIVKNKIWKIITEAMIDINPNSLKINESVFLWLQVLAILNSVNPVEENKILSKIKEINEKNKNLLIYSNRLNYNLDAKKSIKSDIIQKIEILLNEVSKTEDIELVEDFYDDFFNFVNIAVFRNKKYRIGIRIFNKFSFVNNNWDDINNLNMSNSLSNNILENLFGWKILSISEDQYEIMNEEEKIKLINSILN